ncbi:MAG: hypothetical protein ACLP1X_25085 [Polyangiaceae bacterium]
MRKVHVVGIGLLAAAGVVATGVAISSCAATPTNVPVRTFEQAKKMDVVCIAVINPEDGGELAAPEIHGLVQSECAPAQTDFAALSATTTPSLPNHLYAVVTQTTRGELAVVDLTAGNIVDEDRSTPGTNFIPVGTSPTDVVVTPDGLMTFVASADPNKPAIYGIPTGPHRTADGGLAGQLLGDTTGMSPPLPLQLTDLEACALPQPPQALTVAPVAGADGGPSRGYVLVAVLAATPGMPAAVVAIDPTSLLHGGGVDAGLSDAAPATPGILAPCTQVGANSAIALSATLPATWSGGPTWPDGVPYVDAGSLAPQEPSTSSTCTASTADGGAGEADDGGTAADGGEELEAGTFALAMPTSGQPFPTEAALRTDLPILYVGDGVLPLIHEIDLTDPTHPRELPPLLATSITQPTRQVTVGALAISPPTRDYKTYLYAVDQGNGSLMVFDITDPASSPHMPLQRPHPELNPLQPQDRLTFSAPVATVGFVQHDWPLIPPGPNGTANPDQIHAYEGLLCNPNPNAHPDGGTFKDLGAYYRVDQAATVQSEGVVSTVQGFPTRLRGVFGFATLSNGQVVTIDVDDWDAPCRRPDPMATPNPDAGPSYGMTGLLDIPEPAAGPPGSPTYLDPYHAPVTYQSIIPESPAVTQEEYFPVSAPHRMRSQYLLRNDPTAGNHLPNLVGTPQLFNSNGTPVSASGAAAPLILPTTLLPGFVDPTFNVNPTEPNPASQTSNPPAVTSPSSKAVPAVRLSFDDPTVTIAQDWTVTYEGTLPAGQMIPADIESTDGYQTLQVGIGDVAADGGASGSGFPGVANGPGFCERGVEDWSIGQARAAAVVAETQAVTPRLPSPTDLGQWTADYIEVTDELLPQGDPYWSIPYENDDGTVVNDCWEGTGFEDLGPDGKPQNDPNIGDERYQACQGTYGPPSSCPGNGMSQAQTSTCENGSAPTDPDTFLARDFPILHAYDDHLVIGRFGWSDKDSSGKTVPESTNNRVVVGPSSTNPPFLRFMRCCFHHEVGFKVRTGGEWVAVGQNGLGLLSRVVAAPQGTDPSTPSSRPCVLSCDPHDVLLNARSFDVPWATPSSSSSGASCQPPAPFPDIVRTNALAMENPYFSFVTWMGCSPLTEGAHTPTARDLQWKFSVRGGFTPLAVSITGNTSTAVSPQSMRFIESFGQLAIVDGELQGLVLIDLNTLAFAHNPYY